MLHTPHALWPPYALSPHFRLHMSSSGSFRALRTSHSLHLSLSLHLHFAQLHLPLLAFTHIHPPLLTFTHRYSPSSSLIFAFTLYVAKVITLIFSLRSRRVLRSSRRHCCGGCKGRTFQQHALRTGPPHRPEGAHIRESPLGEIPGIRWNQTRDWTLLPIRAESVGHLHGAQHLRALRAQGRSGWAAVPTQGPAAGKLRQGGQHLPVVHQNPVMHESAGCAEIREWTAVPGPQTGVMVRGEWSCHDVATAAGASDSGFLMRKL